MKRIALSTAIAAALFGFVATPAEALPYTGVCPSTNGHLPVGGGGTGSATDCNLLIVVGANSSITTYIGPQANYDGIEDALIGVVNNSGSALGSLNLSGNLIFHFEQDGIDGYTNSPANAQDMANPVNGVHGGYGGPMSYFTNVTLGSYAGIDSGTVNFIGGLASGTGKTKDNNTYFSLEESIDATSLPKITTAVPEPGSLMLFILGSLGLGLAARRRSKT